MALVITNPTALSEWKKETQYTIEWDEGDIVIDYLKLYKNNVFIENIALLFENTQSRNWTPGIGLVSGTDYQIKIQAALEIDWSPNFKIYSAFLVQLNDGLGLSDSMAKAEKKILTDDLTLSDSIKKQIKKILTDDLTLSDSIKKQTTKVLTDDLTLADSIKKQIKKVLLDDLTLSDSIKVSLSTITEDYPCFCHPSYGCLTMSKNAKFPYNPTGKIVSKQIIKEMDGGGVKVADLGTAERQWKLSIEYETESKRNDLLTFFSIVLSSAFGSSFTFIPADGLSYTTYLKNARGLDFPTMVIGNGSKYYSITLVLKEKII